MVVVKDVNDNMEEVSPLGGAATFILKLWRMLSRAESLEIMRWSATGKSFIIVDQVAFITKLLPMYFKHNNMGSFVRQLNLYDFHKIGLDNKTQELEYQHRFFHRNRPDLLKFIKRKLPSGNSRSKKPAFSPVEAKEIHAMSGEVRGMKNKQDDMAQQLNKLQQENLGLLRELGSLHAKQNSQTQVLKRIIEILIPFVDTYDGARNKNEGGVAGKMIENGSVEQKDEAMTDSPVGFSGDDVLDLRDVFSSMGNNSPIIDSYGFVTSPVSDGIAPSTEDFVVEEMDEDGDKATLDYLENDLASLLEKDILNYQGD